MKKEVKRKVIFILVSVLVVGGLVGVYCSLPNILHKNYITASENYPEELEWVFHAPIEKFGSLRTEENKDIIYPITAVQEGADNEIRAAFIIKRYDVREKGFPANSLFLHGESKLVAILYKEAARAEIKVWIFKKYEKETRPIMEELLRRCDTGNK